MEQRDLLKDQIEQLGKVLAEIISDFLKLKSNGNGVKGIEISNERLQSELDIDIEKLITLNLSELKTYLEVHKLTDVHLETLADYLLEIGKMEIGHNEAHAKLKLVKAFELLDLAEDISKTISFDRIHKKNEIKSM